MHRKQCLYTSLTVFIAASFICDIAPAAIFSSITYYNDISVHSPTGDQTNGIAGSTLPVSKTIGANVGPSVQATYTFSDSGNFASLEISTTEAITGVGQYAFEETEANSNSEKFILAQPVSYHFVFQDTVSAGFISDNSESLVFAGRANVYDANQVENSSFESDGTLAAGYTYYLNEGFRLDNEFGSQPATGSGTSDMLLTFTAVPEPSSLCLLGGIAGIATRRRHRHH